MKIIIMISLLFFCMSCIKKEPQFQIETDKCLSSLVLEICREYDLRARKYGEGVIKSENSLEFGFDSKKKLNLDETRNFYFKVVDSLIAKISRNQNLIPFLRLQPFEAEKICVSIAFVEGGFDNHMVDPPYVAYVSGKNNLVLYAIDKKANNELEKIHSESVKRARGILEHQKQLMNICEPSTQ